MIRSVEGDLLSAPSLEELRVCPDCGLINVLPPPRVGADTRCGRCAKLFRRARRHSSTWVLACALTAAVFYTIVLSAPFLEAMLYGRVRSSTLLTGIQTLGENGLWVLASVVLITAIIMPLFRVGGLLIVFGGLHLRQPPRWIVPLFRSLKCTNNWSMVEIYLLGFLVAYTRLRSIVHVHVETAVFALIGLVLSMVSISWALDHETVWGDMRRKGLLNPSAQALPRRMIGCDICHQANAATALICVRCGHPAVHHRKPNSMGRTLALILAAFILYIPANTFPIMLITNLEHPHSYTILGGVREFIHAGLWPLALLVFTASIAVPLIKLVSLSLMLISTRHQLPSFLRKLTGLYRFIDFVGRWSMIDIFMLSILVGLIRFGDLTRITPAPGALYFAAVVVLTMFAVSSFDPRLMWDAVAKEEPHER